MQVAPRRDGHHRGVTGGACPHINEVGRVPQDGVPQVGSSGGGPKGEGPKKGSTRRFREGTRDRASEGARRRPAMREAEGSALSWWEASPQRRASPSLQGGFASSMAVVTTASTRQRRVSSSGFASSMPPFGLHGRPRAARSPNCARLSQQHAVTLAGRSPNLLQLATSLLCVAIAKSRSKSSAHLVSLFPCGIALSASVIRSRCNEPVHHPLGTNQCIHLVQTSASTCMVLQAAISTRGPGGSRSRVARCCSQVALVSIRVIIESSRAAADEATAKWTSGPSRPIGPGILGTLGHSSSTYTSSVFLLCSIVTESKIDAGTAVRIKGLTAGSVKNTGVE